MGYCVYPLHARPAVYTVYEVARSSDRPGKGSYWTLHPESSGMFDNGCFLRRQRRFRCPRKEALRHAARQHQPATVSAASTSTPPAAVAPCQVSETRKNNYRPTAASMMDLFDKVDNQLVVDFVKSISVLHTLRTVMLLFL